MKCDHGGCKEEAVFRTTITGEQVSYCEKHANAFSKIAKACGW